MGVMGVDGCVLGAEPRGTQGASAHLLADVKKNFHMDFRV